MKVLTIEILLFVIFRFLEDNEDLALAKKSLKKMKYQKSLKELREELEFCNQNI